MADANMADFYDRVRKFERMRSKGYGFETPDTLGRSFYNRRNVTKRRAWVMPVLVGLMVVFGLKASLYQAVGADSYENRVARLQAGSGFDPVGGLLMQADPVTLWTADMIAGALARLR